MKRPQPSLESKNIVGQTIQQLRRRDNLSQRGLAYKLQLLGMDIDKNVITRIETGKRFVADFEIKAFAAVFDVSYEDLLDGAAHRLKQKRP